MHQQCKKEHLSIGLGSFSNVARYHITGHLFIPTDMVVYAQPYLSHGTCDAYRRVVHKTFTGVIVKAITHSFMGFDE